MGGNGCLDMMDERPGDAVVLYELEEGEPCPVCNASLPPFQYCPTCGSAWAENGTNIETHLADMQQEHQKSGRFRGITLGVVLVAHRLY